MMRILITSSGATLDSQMDPRFGRAEYFLIVDSESMKHTALDNASRNASDGAGIAAAQAAIDARVDALVTGHLGPNALNVLRDSKIELYEGVHDTISENLRLFKAGQLKLVSGSNQPRFGQGQGGGFGQGHRGGQQ